MAPVIISIRFAHCPSKKEKQKKESRRMENEKRKNKRNKADKEGGVAKRAQKWREGKEK